MCIFILFTLGGWVDEIVGRMAFEASGRVDEEVAEALVQKAGKHSLLLQEGTRHDARWFYSFC